MGSFADDPYRYVSYLVACRDSRRIIQRILVGIMKFNIMQLFNAKEDDIWSFGHLSKYKLMTAETGTDTQISSTHRLLQLSQLPLKFKVKAFQQAVDRKTSELLGSQEEVREHMEPLFRKYQLVAMEMHAFHMRNRADITAKETAQRLLIMHEKEAHKKKVADLFESIRVALDPDMEDCATALDQLEELAALVQEA